MALDDPRIAGGRHASGFVFPVPVPDFRLLRIDLDAHGGSCTLRLPGPMIVLSVSGKAEVAAQADGLTLRPGHAAFIAARDAGVTLSGCGLAFVAPRRTRGPGLRRYRLAGMNPPAPPGTLIGGRANPLGSSPVDRSAIVGRNVQMHFAGPIPMGNRVR